MDLLLTEKSSDFLTYLQQLEFSCDDGSCSDPSQQADIHRNLYLHLIRSSGLAGNSNCGRSSRIQSQWASEADKYLGKYSQIVDTMSDKGLNNFAEKSLALCNYHKNESTKWTTSLSVDKILQMSLQQNNHNKDDVTDVQEDCLITLQTARTISIGLPGLEQGCCQTSTQASKTEANSGPKQRLWPPSHHPSNISPDSILGLHSTSSAAGGTSYKNTNSGWHQPVISNPPFGTYLNHPTLSSTGAMVGNQPVFETLRHAPHSRPDHMFKDNCGRNEHEMTSSRDLLVNASTVGGPYSNFGQKPKSSPRSGYKERRNGGTLRRNEDDDVAEDSHTKPLPFRTAKEQLVINQQKKFGGGGGGFDRSQVLSASYGAGKKSLGTRRGPASKFVPPVISKDSDENDNLGDSRLNPRQREDDASDEPVDARLRGIEPKMIELINNEIMDHGTPVLWSDIAGLEFAKKTIKEIVVWPMLRPDIFTGLRGPPKGLLLFGPPGTGKTLIGKCIASQSKSTFFSISASSLTSKWVGEGEKMVRALFAVARCHQPSVVFIDEIDSLLSQRSDTEHESTRRIKTEFLVQLDGAGTNSEDKILVIGATNRPQEIDEAARRRFVKRLLIPLPEAVARRQIITNLMSHQNVSLTEEDIQVICDKTGGYSGADMTNLCREAALGPIRSIPFELMETITPEQVRPISYQDFEEALLQVRASVSSKDLQLYTDWNQTYGSFGH